MKNQELEEIYDALQKINEKLNEINQKLEVKKKISKDDSDNIEGIKYEIRNISGAIATHLKL